MCSGFEGQCWASSYNKCRHKNLRNLDKHKASKHHPQHRSIWTWGLSEVSPGCRQSCDHLPGTQNCSGWQNFSWAARGQIQRCSCGGLAGGPSTCLFKLVCLNPTQNPPSWNRRVCVFFHIVFLNVNEWKRKNKAKKSRIFPNHKKIGSFGISHPALSWGISLLIWRPYWLLKI